MVGKYFWELRSQIFLILHAKLSCSAHCLGWNYSIPCDSICRKVLDFFFHVKYILNVSVLEIRSILVVWSWSPSDLWPLGAHWFWCCHWWGSFLTVPRSHWAGASWQTNLTLSSWLLTLDTNQEAIKGPLVRTRASGVIQHRGGGLCHLAEDSSWKTKPPVCIPCAWVQEEIYNCHSI